MNAPKPTPQDVLELTRDLDKWINRTAPVMKRISNKQVGETSLEISVIQAADCAWHLLGLMRRVAAELGDAIANGAMTHE